MEAGARETHEGGREAQEREMDGKRTERINLRVSKAFRESLDEAKLLSGAASYSEVVRRAVTLFLETLRASPEPKKEAPPEDDRLEVLESALKALFEHNTNMWGDLELAQFLAARGVDVSRYATWWSES
jgi:Arc/MetJ-type ribon-helix-helix transcriptional regulator